MPIDTTEEPVEPKKDEPLPKEDPEGYDGRAEEPKGRTEASPDPEDNFKIDVQPPKGLEQESEALQKQFRDAWLKKNSENADRIRAAEVERDRLAAELAQRNRAFDELALKGGGAPKAPEPEPVPEFQDMGQLTRYVEDKAAQKADAAVQARMTQFEQRKAYEDRWVSAWNTVTENDKGADLFREIVRKELMDPKSEYLRFYNGQNETEVLQRTVEGTRKIYETYTQRVKQETIADMKRKKSAVTERPGKAVSVGKDPREMNKADIIAEMNAELGPVS